MLATAVDKYEAVAELARRNPVDFACAYNPHYKPAWFHHVIGNHLVEVAAGNIKRLIINMPPRHGKSEECSRMFPPWYLGNEDNRSIIASSYNANLVRSFGRAARNAVNHPIYRDIFGVKLNRQFGTAASDWSLSNGSSYACAGVGGGITGLGAHIFLIDDPIKDRREADSAVYRERLKDWYKEVALTRLTPDGAIVIIMTRWHHDDLVGWLLREWTDKNWTVLRFPAIKDEEENDYDKRKVGEALWEERYSIKHLNDIESEMDALSFNCIFQQIAKVPEGAVINIDDFVQDFYLDDLPEFTRIITSWDTAFEEKKLADFSVGLTVGDTGTDYYLIDLVRGRWRFPKLKKKVEEVYNKWNEDSVLVEAKASGKDIIYELRDGTDIPIIPIEPKGNKVNRAAAVSGRVEAGRVHIPKSAPWLRLFLNEVEHFPKVDHDDQVDAFTQAIRWLTRYSSSVIS